MTVTVGMSGVDLLVAAPTLTAPAVILATAFFQRNITDVITVGVEG